MIAIQVHGREGLELDIAHHREASAIVLNQKEMSRDGTYRLQISPELSDWSDLATSWGGFIDYFDSETSTEQRYYRVICHDETVAPDWTNQLGPDPSEFISGPRFVGDIRWVKFAFERERPETVYFQHSRRFPFHFDFATRHLPAYRGVGGIEFDSVTLFPESQTLVLGTVLFSPDPTVKEIGIQFVGREAFSIENIKAWLQRVSMRLRLVDQWRVIYMPTFDQQAVAESARGDLLRQGIEVDSPARWTKQDAVYAEGWALGRLQFIEASELAGAYSEGRVRPTDILLLDRVPAEVPPVAGIISLTPGTPNSHVAILAHSFGVPFGYVADAARRAQLTDWAGEDIFLITAATAGGAEVSTLRVGNELDEEAKARLLSLKELPPLSYTPVRPADRIAFPGAELTPDHLDRVGGKAANFGFLLRSIPDNAPVEAIAFSFDLWDAFLGQTLLTGSTLRETIRQALGNETYPPVDPASLASRLAEVRVLITDEAVFSDQEQQQIIDVLAPLDTGRKIRFRSSTNVEDGELFSGAGLYDSFSGCLADDLDDDSIGPSHCDSTKGKERGVFRALKKVFASFYNDNAFLERLRRGVREDEVGMAVLAHYSFPDDIEEANGVATMRLNTMSPHDQPRLIEASLVTQREAVSIANPDQTATPEVVRVENSLGGVRFELEQDSSLVPLGATVLTWTDDYARLTELLVRAGTAYLEYFPNKREVLLDFEYKKISSGQLVVKQIREVPSSPFAGEPAPLSFSDVDAFEVVQGEFGDMMARHRLKSVWRFQSWGIVGDEPIGNPAGRLSVELEFLHHGELTRFQGAMIDLPGASMAVEGRDLIYDWYWGEGDQRVDYELTFNFLYALDQRPSPLLELADAEIELSARYSIPQPRFDLFQDSVTMVSEESVRLADINPPMPDAKFPNVTWTRHVEAESGNLAIDSDFYIGTYQIRGETPFILKTFVLQAWEKTSVTVPGYGPLDLRSTYSQTYWPGHHNFIETVVVEPGLESGVEPTLLSKLAAENVRGWIVIQDSANVSPDLTSRIVVWTWDNELVSP